MKHSPLTLSKALVGYAFEIEAAEKRAAMADDRSNTTYTMRERLESYQHGVNGTIPKWLQPHLNKVLNEEDPEYNDYVRLKHKFENREY